jgi:hypothetical protein
MAAANAVVVRLSGSQHAVLDLQSKRDQVGF